MSRLIAKYIQNCINQTNQTENMKRNITKIKRIRRALLMLNANTFRCESCYPKLDAQRNLRGRTHYFDEETMKSFGSRVNQAGDPFELNKELSKKFDGHMKGLFFFAVESVATRPDHGGKNKRVLMFDVFGDVVDPAVGECVWHKTFDGAMNQLFRFLEGGESVEPFDPIDHYEWRISEKIKFHRRTAKRANDAINGREEKRIPFGSVTA